MNRRKLLGMMGASGAALLIPSQVYALAAPRSYFVSGSGSDGNDGLTSATPLRSLQAASDRALPGDTVLAMNGDYTNPYNGTDILTIRNPGAAGAPITYRNFPGHRPRVVVGKHNWQGILIQASYITVEGFEVAGNAAAITYAYALSQKDNWGNAATSANGLFADGRKAGTLRNIVMRNNTVHHMPGGGLSAIACDYVTIEDNKVHSCGWWSPYQCSGISVYSSRNAGFATAGYRTIVRRNESFNNENYIPYFGGTVITDGNGIIIDDNKNTQHPGVPAYTGRTLVENNLCYNNGGTGMHAFLSANVDFINNTAYFNNRCPQLDNGEIIASRSASVRFHNNILHARTGKKCQTHYGNAGVTFDSNIYYNGSTAVRGATDIVADPKFVKASLIPAEADFRTVLASPATGSGTPDLAPDEDKDLRPRPSGIGFDRGAYQLTITNDLTAPVVTIAAGTASGLLRGGLPGGLGTSAVPGQIVRVAATAADESGVKQVNFYVNGKFVKSSTGPAYVFDFMKPASGKTSTILAKATDNAGNTGTSNKIVI